jgi:hypothetical protein
MGSKENFTIDLLIPVILLPDWTILRLVPYHAWRILID